MIIHDTLNTLGLEERETDIYLALLRLGPVSIRDIASAVNINRGTVYEVLKDLRERSLVSQFPKGKRKYFCAENPEVLLEMAADKEKEIQHARQLLTSEIIPDLATMRSVDSTTQVRHYEGDEGIEFVLRDILRTVDQRPDKLYRVYSSRLIRKYLYRPFPNFTRQRVQKNIYVNVIAIGEGGEEAPFAQRKWIDTGTEDVAASYVAIYPPKCAMIYMSKQDYPSVVILESSAIALALKLSFDTLWGLL